MKTEPKFYVKKRTKSGRYIVIAEGSTRKELIDSLKRDSLTYRDINSSNNSNNRERYRDGKAIYGDE
jgi:hypothetical protein